MAMVLIEGWEERIYRTTKLVEVDDIDDSILEVYWSDETIKEVTDQDDITYQNVMQLTGNQMDKLSRVPKAVITSRIQMEKLITAKGEE